MLQIGEFVQDFVEVRRAYDEWAPATSSVDRMMEGNILHHLDTVGDRHGVPDMSVHSTRLSPHSSGPYTPEQVMNISEKV